MPGTSSSEPIPEGAVTIVLVDDHRFFRNGIRTMLESGGYVVIGEAGTAREGLRVACEHRPDVVMLDVGLPDVSGLEVIAEMRRQAPESAIVMMTGSADREDIVRALGAGATGYLVKDGSLEELLETVAAAASGQALLSREVTTTLLEHVRSAEPEPAPASAPLLEQAELTDRELSVLRLVADGLANPEIAQALSLSVGSVKSDLAGVLLKLGVENRVQAAVAAVRQGLLD